MHHGQRGQYLATLRACLGSQQHPKPALEFLGEGVVEKSYFFWKRGPSITQVEGRISQSQPSLGRPYPPSLISCVSEKSGHLFSSCAHPFQTHSSTTQPSEGHYKEWERFFFQNDAISTGRVAQVVECLANKHEALSSYYSTAKKKTKKKKKKKENAIKDKDEPSVTVTTNMLGSN
jgi:hypothetical protein